MGTISVSSLSKAYKKYPSRWARLKDWFAPNKNKLYELTWVLKGINFQVAAGEAVGILGINGAGKSTLLKMITGTAQPTSGSVKTTGRVAALLELGMGFHPDFTGRQNAIMAGQLLGMKTEDIRFLMPEVESFAEIGEYIDMPVRVYSSGMQVRLAFSVATAIRPDILIVDEALSVGDAYFQHKSFDRIRAFREQGTTLLIVSHDKAAIQSICDRAILLNAGALEFEGKPEAVMDYYNAMLADHQKQHLLQVASNDGVLQTLSGSGEAYVESVVLLDEKALPIEVVSVGQVVRLRLTVKARVDVVDLVVGYLIKDRLGQSVFGTNTHHMCSQPLVVKKDKSVVVEFEFFANMGVGNYSIAVALHASESHLLKNYEWRDRSLMFNVINKDKQPFEGTAWLPSRLEWREQ